MRRLIVAAVVLAVCVSAVHAQSIVSATGIRYTFTDSSLGSKATALFWDYPGDPLGNNKPNKNTGGEQSTGTNAYLIWGDNQGDPAQNPAGSWMYMADCFYTDLSFLSGKLVTSSTFIVRDVKANGGGIVGVELHRILSTQTWLSGSGTAAGRGGRGGDSGAGYYWADYDPVTRSGTTWGGQHLRVDTDTWKVPANGFQNSAIDTLTNTSLITSATIWSSVDGQKGGFFGGFAMRTMVQDMADSVIRNNGFALYSGRAHMMISSTAGGLNVVQLNYATTNFHPNEPPYDGTVYYPCGLAVSFTNRIPGDATNDGSIDASDYAQWFNNYGAVGGWRDGNFHEAEGDPYVDATSYADWFNNYGFTLNLNVGGGEAPAPEPMSMALLVAGLPLLMRRRSRLLRKREAS